MNTNSFLKLLRICLGQLRFSPEILKELCGILVTSGRESKFLVLLAARLRTLDQLGAYATSEPEFESIGGGLFSMHFAASGFNIRILYAFLPNREPVLLLAFYEREGKGKTDYSQKLEPAKERFRLLKEEFENEPYRC